MISIRTLNKRSGLACAVALAVCCTASTVAHAALIPAPAGSVTLPVGQSVKLDQLTLNQISGVVVGDKLFSNFVYSYTNNMPTPGNVNVVAISNGTDIGIRFQGSFGDLPGGGASDASVSFKVSVLDTERSIKGAQLQSAVFLDPNTPGSFGSVDESFLSNSPSISDLLHVFNSTLGAGGSQFEDHTTFANTYTTLNVQKDIFAHAADLAVQPVRMTFIDQLFPQDGTPVIPEPTSVALLISCAAMLGINRRR
jgi:hypothetical protein